MAATSLFKCRSLKKFVLYVIHRCHVCLLLNSDAPMAATSLFKCRCLKKLVCDSSLPSVCVAGRHRNNDSTPSLAWKRLKNFSQLLL